MLKDVRVSPRHAANGLTENHRGFPTDSELRVFGADTETVRGLPYTYQIVADNGDEIIRRCSSKNILHEMMSWIFPRCRSKGVNVVWFHNLNFDIRSVFCNERQIIYDQYNDIHFTVPVSGSIKRGNYYGYAVKLLYGKVNHATLWEDHGGYLCPRCGPDRPVPKDATGFSANRRVCSRHRTSEPVVKRNYGRRVQFFDSAAFCPPGQKSLAAALKIYGVAAKKLPKPRGLGKRRVWSKAFQKYSMNDARAELKLGNAILDVHRKYDVALCVSLPQLAARVLRHHFFTAGESIQFPPEPARLAAEFSYHAGKNGFYVKRGIYEDVYEYDINSAFPKAMKDLPQMVKGQYRRTDHYEPGLCGVYRITGRCHGAKIPAIFDHEFVPIKQGRFRRVWVTGFEIECLLHNPEYSFAVSDGWVWEPDPSYIHSPLAAYVDNFWKLKSEAPKGPLRDLYKNLLNSLYGKFAACVEKREIVETKWGHEALTQGGDKYYVAGSLYHPFIAGQITGMVRRDLFRLEQAGHAFHSATDSIKSKLKLPTSDTLGGIKEEVYGRCYLFRTKLYLHFAKDTTRCGHNLTGWIRQAGTDRLGTLFDGPDRQHLCKWALHGFKGSVFDLYRHRDDLLRRGYLDYGYQHMVNLREGLRRGETVSDMIQRKERLILPENGVTIDDYNATVAGSRIFN